MSAIQRGDSVKAMELHNLLNAQLEVQESPTFDMPLEYFDLLHKAMSASTVEESQLINIRIQTIMQEVGMPTIPEVPEECQRLQEEATAAAEAKDHSKSVALNKAYDRCMQAHGIEGFGLPDEYYELQGAAGEAFEREDWVGFRAACKRSEEILNERGIFNIVNIIQDDAGPEEP